MTGGRHKGMKIASTKLEQASTLAIFVGGLSSYQLNTLNLHKFIFRSAIISLSAPYSIWTPA